jgi:hypothetical protein
MKKKYWNVQIEQLANGTVNAAVVRSRWYVRLPQDTYGAGVGREVWSIWFESEAEAREAVVEALSMNKKADAVA